VRTMRGDGKYAKLNPRKDPGRALNSMEAAHLLARQRDALYQFQQIRVELGEAPSASRSS
jgi:hypothetical protein